MADAHLTQIDISRRLRELMLQNSLTVAQLAELSGASKSALEKYLSGPSSPRAVTLANICQQLSVSPSWLLFGRPEVDEISEAVNFHEGVRHSVADAFQQIRTDEELFKAFCGSDPASKEWKVFPNDLAYLVTKRAFASFKKLRQPFPFVPFDLDK